MEIEKRKVLKGIVNGIMGGLVGMALAYGYEFYQECEFPEGTLDEQVQCFSRWDEQKIISELEHWEIEAQDPNGYCDNLSKKDIFSICYLSARLGILSPQQGIELLPGIPGIEPSVSRMVFTAWSEWAPEESFACFKQKGTILSAHKKILLPVARNLIKNKPEAMLELLNNLPEGKSKLFTPVAFSFLMKFHPEYVLSSLSEWEKTGTASKRMYAEIAQKWASEDWESTKNWIRTLSSEWRDDVSLYSLSGLMSKNVESASKIFVSLTGEDQKRVLPFLLQSLNELSPLSAVKWLSEHVSNEVYLNHIEMAMGDDFFVPSDVKEFILSMKDGNVKDQALYYMYERDCLYYLIGDNKMQNLGYYKHSPEEVLSWICLMSNLKRKTYLGNNFVVWAGYDYEKAHEWLNKSNLTEENRQIIESDINLSELLQRR